MASEAGEKGWYWGLEARRCDTCRASPALLFCRVDSAFLCGGCDARVHGANRLGSRHPRVWLCEVCEQAPAAVTCKADAAALCTACDADIHSANPLARRHERHPIVPFLDPASSAPKPSVAAAADGGPAGSILDPSDEDEAQEAAASWLLPEPCPNPKAGLMVMEAPELKSADYYFPEVDPYLDLEYASSMDTGFNHADGVVPVVHGKPVAGGAPPPPLLPPEGGCIELDFTGSKTCYSSYSVSSSEVGVVPDGGGGAMTDVTNPYGGGGGGGGGNKPASAMDREARVMRYREKRKNRKFQKTIRYASRKAYAETRPRIKGRFAKRAEVEAEVVVGRMYSSTAAATAAIMLDPGYGVVPSF